MPDILDSLGPNEVAIFIKDFKELIRVAHGMDKGYGSINRFIDDYLPKYKKLLKLFNKKYTNLFLKLKVTDEELILQIFIKENSVADVFQNAASKIVGLKSIGASGFGRADVSNSEKFTKEVSKLRDKIFITYYEAEAGSNTLFLEYIKKEKKVLLHYEYKGISDDNSPSFKLCAYYALKDGFDNKIDVYTTSSLIGFTDLLNDVERDEWMKRFNPPWTE